MSKFMADLAAQANIVGQNQNPTAFFAAPGKILLQISNEMTQ
jgi:hypothetical protein